MAHLYVVGGQQRETILKTIPEWHSCRKAVIIHINTEDKRCTTALEYLSPAEAFPGGTASISFKAGTLQDNKLYLCTSTELVTYTLPDFAVSEYVSLPCFNDLHHVSPTPAGNRLVANTGLDMVVELTPSGEILREWNVLGEDPWQRFSRSVDYRKVLTTKPHKSHPNFVFQLGDDVWVTRLMQKDAICLTQPGKRIDIGIERIHDGHLYKDWIYFTSVDGHVVIANQRTLKVEEIIDLNTIEPRPAGVLGWCRGLMIVDDSKVWVGFTRIRPTKFRENVMWLKHGMRDVDKASHIALYDITRKSLVDEVELQSHGLDVVFSIFDASHAEQESKPVVTAESGASWGEL